MGLLSKWLHKTRTHVVASYVDGAVLDLGCGEDATILKIVSGKIEKFYGIDIEQSIITQLNERHPKAKFFVRNLDEDNFNLDIKFDRILLVAVIEHLFNQKHLFKEILKYLKPSGKIIITSPTYFGNDIIHRWGSSIGLFSNDSNDDHIVIYNKQRFKILAKEFNLKIEKYEKFELGCNQLVILTKAYSAY